MKTLDEIAAYYGEAAPELTQGLLEAGVGQGLSEEVAGPKKFLAASDEIL